MTDTPFSADEVRELEVLGFIVTGADETLALLDTKKTSEGSARPRRLVRYLAAKRPCAVTSCVRP
jgi:hypothetical protein